LGSRRSKSMHRPFPDFRTRALAQQAEAGETGAAALLDAGRAWDLAPAVRAGGSLIFPHATLAACGHQIAAAVHACLDSSAPRVLVIGVLHARLAELQDARRRVARGGDPARELSWGIQGPNLPGHEEWREEFSLSHFLFLWEHETRRRGIPGPELQVCYPCLAGGRPDLLPSIAPIRGFARGAAGVAPTAPVRHVSRYGDPPGKALAPEAGGLDLARRRITQGLTLLRDGDYRGYEQHCIAARSDGRDTGQLLHCLTGLLEPRILD